MFYSRRSPKKKVILFPLPNNQGNKNFLGPKPGSHPYNWLVNNCVVFYKSPSENMTNSRVFTSVITTVSDLAGIPDNSFISAQDLIIFTQCPFNYEYSRSGCTGRAVPAGRLFVNISGKATKAETAAQGRISRVTPHTWSRVDDGDVRLNASTKNSSKIPSVCIIIYGYYWKIAFSLTPRYGQLVWKIPLFYDRLSWLNRCWNYRMRW